MDVRAAEDADVEALARLWWAGWHDAHAAILPAELTRLRTVDSFTDRMWEVLAAVRAIGPPGRPIGFHYVKEDELNQFYLAAEARGSGAAGPLIADAEACLSARGVRTAWLACAIGNLRAARFYEKSGWRLAATTRVLTETSAGPYPLDIWRYEKRLAGEAG
ncbi:MAG TPA: GNAT family N-acetyltransferase [Caulobacteraceae bacterium]|nr:GNAT family N-acetyltransferase [Caulobacteraceae bacterium]